MTDVLLGTALIAFLSYASLMPLAITAVPARQLAHELRRLLPAAWALRPPLNPHRRQLKHEGPP